MSEYTIGKAWKLEKQKHILEAAFRLFAEKGIEAVSIPEIAEASGVGRATLFRYFPSKLDLVVTIATRQWDGYINGHDTLLTPEQWERMSGADLLRFYMDAFIDLYRSRQDILRFNYDFNSFLRHKAVPEELRQPYLERIDRLAEEFHMIYDRGMKDGTLNPEIPETSVFSALMHIMLAAAARYAVGLVYIQDTAAEPEEELIMLKDLLLSKFIKKK